MIYCLDTDICIFTLKGGFAGIRTRMERQLPSHIKIPSMVRAELLLEAEKSSRPRKVHDLVEQFLLPFETLAFDEGAAEIYARIRNEVETAGQPIGPNDLVIASTSLSHGATLVTHNTDEFSRIGGLRLEDWTE